MGENVTKNVPAKTIVEHPSPLTGIATAGWMFVLVIYFLIREYLDENDLQEVIKNELLTIIWIILAITVVAFIQGIIQWRTTTFSTQNELVITRNFIFHSTSRIGYNKIQSVDINCPINARIFGLVELKIDVGSEGEQRLKYLTRARGEQLRDQLLARMDGTISVQEQPSTAVFAQHQEDDSGVAIVSQPSLQSTPGDTNSAQVAETFARQLTQTPSQYELGRVSSQNYPDRRAETTIFKLSPTNILIGGLLYNGFGIIFGVVFAVFAIVLCFTVWRDNMVPGILLALGLLWVGPDWIMKNWNFTLARVSDGIRISKGAFNTMQTVLKPKRVQTIVIKQSFFTRLTGLYLVKISVLGNSATDEKDSISTLLPIGSLAEVQQVVQLVWPDVDVTSFNWQCQARKGKWVSWFANHYFSVTENLVASKHTMLSTNIYFTRQARVQGLRIEQGPIKRLLRITNLRVCTVAQDFDVVFRNLAEPTARQIFVAEIAETRRARNQENRPIPARAKISDPDFQHGEI